MLRQGLGKVLKMGGGSAAAIGALTVMNPAVGTLAGVGAATGATFAGARKGIRSMAARGLSDGRMRGSMRASSSPVDRARSFAYRRPMTTAALAGVPLGGALYSGGPGRGQAASRRNQRGYYMNAMRRGQGGSSGIAGITAQSLGGLA